MCLCQAEVTQTPFVRSRTLSSLRYPSSEYSREADHQTVNQRLGLAYLLIISVKKTQKTITFLHRFMWPVDFQTSVYLSLQCSLRHLKYNRGISFGQSNIFAELNWARTNIKVP